MYGSVLLETVRSQTHNKKFSDLHQSEASLRKDVHVHVELGIHWQTLLNVPLSTEAASASTKELRGSIDAENVTVKLRFIAMHRYT